MGNTKFQSKDADTPPAVYGTPTALPQMVIGLPNAQIAIEVYTRRN